MHDVHGGGSVGRHDEPVDDEAGPPINEPPLDLSSLKADPCSMFSTAALQALGLTPGQVDSAGVTVGPTCQWRSAATVGPRLTGAVNTKTGGLEGLYARRNGFRTFNPLAVDGYRAVEASRAVLDGVCEISVGVNDAELFQLSINTALPAPPGFEHTCEKTTELLTTVIAGLK